MQGGVLETLLTGEKAGRENSGWSCVGGGGAREGAGVGLMLLEPLEALPVT